MNPAPAPFVAAAASEWVPLIELSELGLVGLNAKLEPNTFGEAEAGKARARIHFDGKYVQLSGTVSVKAGQTFKTGTETLLEKLWAPIMPTAGFFIPISVAGAATEVGHIVLSTSAKELFVRNPGKPELPNATQIELNGVIWALG